MESLHNVEKKVFENYIQDGIIDIVNGFMLFAMGLLFYLQSPFSGLCCLAVFLIKPLKNKISVPRIGYFKPSRRIKRYQIQGFIIAVSILTLVVLFITVPSMHLFYEVHGGYIFGLLFFIAGVAGYCAYGIKRYLVYAAAAAIFFISAELINISFYGAMMTCGFFMFLIGLRMLFVFVRNNPVLSTEQ